MDLGNIVETIVHHIQIGGMACLGRRDEFPMIRALDLTIPLLSLWCIDIDLSIQPMSFTLYMT